MYLDEYKRWLEADLEDCDLKPELLSIKDNDDEIKERFAVALKFGTAGLRGTLGAGTNRQHRVSLTGFSHRVAHRLSQSAMTAVSRAGSSQEMRQAFWLPTASMSESMMS